MNVNWPFEKCGRCEVGLSLLAAGTLAETERAKIEAHVAKCATCRAKLAELQNLAHELSRTGQHLPEVKAPVSLRRRWVTAVRESARQDREPLRPMLPIWLSSRRMAWGSLAAMWTLVLFFRFSAPDAPEPTSVAVAMPSLREVLLALKVDDREAGRRAEASVPTRRKQSQPEALPPRSQRPNVAPTKWEAA
jgi:anti-sigma factor RsiW